MTDSNRIDHAVAARFVRDLFFFVLCRHNPSDKEVDLWTRHLMENGDAIGIFQKFIHSMENKQRLCLLSDSETQYANGHFYSPVVSRRQIEADRDRIFKRGAPLGVDFDDIWQCEMFGNMAPHFSGMPFHDHPDGGHRYHYANTSYGYGDAIIYWGMLSVLRPKRLIEVGCGFTSALALDAIDRLQLETRCTFIDPYPELALKVTAPLGSRHEILAQPIQHVDPDMVAELEHGDLLFIDSSHVVKTGSDVHFEVTELLPRLRPGVVVHFHDTFYPFEYPEGWVVKDNKSWNELYFLQAFLMFNNSFRIMYSNQYFRKLHADKISALGGEMARRILLNPGGGLWIQRR